MKTYYFSSTKISIYSILGFFSLIITSCGSYQNSSYYDNDGVYGSTSKSKEETAPNKYQEYFRSLKDNQDEVITDVDNYSTYNDTIDNSVYQNDTNSYSSWGSNGSENITINVYDNNWGYNYWNNYWYGNYWGYNNWGWNNWGWNNWYGPSYYGYYGYNPGWYGYGYGYGNGYYGNQYSYGRGRRNPGNYGNANGVNYSTGRNAAQGTRARTQGTRNANYSNPRSIGTRDVNATRPTRNFNNNSGTTPRTNTNTPRNYNNNNNNNSTPRTYNSTPRTNNSTPRSYNSAPTRSYSAPSGGGNSGGGGGRSSGGGGGRR